MNRKVFVLAVGFLLTAAGVMGAQVTNVELGYQDGSTVVRIDVQGPIRFTHATEVPKEGRPDRVIVDILSATHELGAKEFLDLPACVVTGIRSSQYSVSPEKIVRVVLDVSRSPIYRVESDDRSIIIYIEDKTTTQFPAWSSNAVTGGEARNAVVPQPSAPAVSEAPIESDEAVTVAEKNEQIEDDRQASLADATPSEPVQAEPVQIEPELAVEPQPTPAPVRRSAPSVKDLMTAFGQPSWASKQAATEAPLPKSEPQPEAPTVPVEPGVTQADVTPIIPDQAAPPAPPVTEPPTTEVATTPASSLYTPEAFAIQTAEQLKSGAETSPMAAQDVDLGKPEAPIRPTEPTAATPLEVGTETPSAPAPTPVVAEQSPVPQADSAKPVPADFLPALPEGSGEEMAVDANTASETSTARFRRSSAASIKTKGTMVAEFPQRLVIKYESDIYRDPFGTLLDDERTYNSPIEQRIPNVEGLKLVGVLEAADAANRALFEDKEGYSYILKSGDKVHGGYVLRVETDRVYFQIFEYGWSRTVALTME